MRKAWFNIKNKKAYIVGNVCMDMIMLDITEIDCKEGDRAILFDNDTSASLISETCGSISYKLLSGISLRVPRVII
jgi:alanine racemase